MTGKTLGGRYTIIEKIDSGGMATVYKAKCNLLNRIVAVKILKPEFSDDADFVRRFRREAQAAASLCHPNIVAIYDVGDEDGLYYIVMEYVKGKTLKEIIKEKAPMSPQEVLDIGFQICNALECAHKNKIVHRDIKSQNIMITPEGIVKVTDFGIARAATGATITNTGNVFGSVHYFSPEQAKSDIVDERSDIYSLGIVLYEAFAGKLPFDGETPVSIALKQVQQKATPISNIIPGFPVDLEAVVEKCMMKNPNRRFQSARELKNNLQVLSRRTDIINFKPKDLGETLVMTKLLDSVDDAADKNNSPAVKKQVKASKKPYKKIAMILALVAIFGLFSFLGASFARRWFDVEIVDVPELIGKTEEEAIQKLKDVGLKGEIVERVYDEAPAGEIVDQDPKAGEKVKVNHPPINLIVSRGPKTSRVTNLIGISEQDAITMLGNDGFDVGKISRKHSDEAKGLVIDQNPRSGVSLPEGSAINFTVSLGPREIKESVPSLIGRSISDAEAILSEHNLAVGNISKEPSDAPEDTVINQEPGPGIKLKQGSRIALVLSKGPVEPIETKKITLNIPLPSEPAEFLVKVEVSDDLGKRTVYKNKNTPEDSPLEVNVEGQGKMHIKVWLDDKLHYKKTLNE